MKYKDVNIIAENQFTPKVVYNNYVISLTRKQIENMKKHNYDFIDEVIDKYVKSEKRKLRIEKLKNILYE